METCSICLDALDGGVAALACGHRFHAASIQRVGVRTEVYRVGKNKEEGPFLARLDELLRRHGPHEAFQATDGWTLRGPIQAEWEAWWHDRSAVIYEDDGMERDWNEVAESIDARELREALEEEGDRLVIDVALMPATRA